jgi:hypothetical protein
VDAVLADDTPRVRTFDEPTLSGCNDAGINESTAFAAISQMAVTAVAAGRAPA